MYIFLLFKFRNNTLFLCINILLLFLSKSQWAIYRLFWNKVNNNKVKYESITGTQMIS